MKTVPFRREHLDQMDFGASEQNDSSMGAFLELAGDLSGPSKTLMYGDKPVGAFGIVVSDDVGWSWAVFSDALRAHPVALHRTAMRELCAVKGLRVVHGTVKHGWKEGAEWLQRLGYVWSGTIKTPDGILERYSRWA